MDVKKESLKLHKKNRGKLSVTVKVPIRNKKDLSLTYTPGVAAACLEIAKKKQLAYDYTIKGNSVAVITNGTAVLGLGNIGALAGLPVMEGKAALFKKFANIDAYPICIATEDPNELLKTIKLIAPGFGGINLEDIKAPECFIVENALQNIGIPVMHDDQHGTAIVVLAALINAAKATRRVLTSLTMVINGAGAAGIAIAQLLLAFGVPGKHIVVCDSKGAITENRRDMNAHKMALARKINGGKIKGTLTEVIKNTDVFIGVSKAGALTKTMVKSMHPHPIIIAMANPIPEIMPEDARQAGASIIATGRSDFPNQVNNVLAFPGIFRGALDCGATHITIEMKLAAAKAIAGIVKKPNPKKIIPSPFDARVAPAVANAVRKSFKQN